MTDNIKKMFVLVSLVILTGCSTAAVCKGVTNKTEKNQCTEADRQYYNNTGWRYDYPARHR